jgi:predicted tellurium resistance membrane protein TerC
MPRCPLPTLTLSVGLAVVLAAVLHPARGQDADPNGQATAAERPDFPRVRVDRTDGSSMTSTLRLTTIRLKTETDTRDIDLKHVRRVTFQKEPGGQSQDMVQLNDKSVVRGRVLEDTFPVQADDGVTVIRAADLRELRLVREERVSLTTVVIGLLTLAAMEIVLGIDNIIFLAIIAGKLPEPQQPKARRLGLIAALGTRLLLLFTLSFLLGLTRPLFTLPDLPLLHDLEAREVSWRDLILLGGGLFLIGKSVREMHEKLEEARAERAGQPAPAGKPVGFAKTIVTIAVIDIVFSLDSVITAVGMVEQLWVMVVAMVIAMFVMLWFSGPISRFVDKNPTIKVLALAFLILIGVMLVAEGLGQHIDKGYIYFAMAFAVGIEMINMRLRKTHKKSAG